MEALAKSGNEFVGISNQPETCLNLNSTPNRLNIVSPARDCLEIDSGAKPPNQVSVNFRPASELSMGFEAISNQFPGWIEVPTNLFQYLALEFLGVNPEH